MKDKKACDNLPAEQAPLHSGESRPAETDSPKIYDSEELLGGRQEILIRHRGELYRLRLTRNDKLILNK